eukprot:CAMPEP_0176016912 /NCGR_PEP_ID=MMETSP0120_2-20121206/8094_1 /TAXON_ID=160619 /ORGANISM="Kryptoperidinium foliaceum, Strain CCMP 1326" /LENGTH=440 /DNA_ID=CAMNT_0017349921 /DNA_START=52 /DNA_END=1373 /DNA_ORIENTATION=-
MAHEMQQQIAAPELRTDGVEEVAERRRWRRSGKAQHPVLHDTVCLVQPSGWSMGNTTATTALCGRLFGQSVCECDAQLPGLAGLCPPGAPNSRLRSPLPHAFLRPHVAACSVHAHGRAHARAHERTNARMRAPPKRTTTTTTTPRRATPQRPSLAANSPSTKSNAPRRGASDVNGMSSCLRCSCRRLVIDGASSVDVVVSRSPSSPSSVEPASGGAGGSGDVPERGDGRVPRPTVALVVPAVLAVGSVVVVTIVVVVVGQGVKAVHPTVAALEVPAIGEATMAVDTWDATVVPDDVCHGRSGAEAGRARPERRLAAEAALVVLSVCEASEVVDAWVCATLVPSVACAGLYVEEAPLGACLQFCCRRRRRDHGSRLRGRGVVVDVGTDRGNASSSKEGAVGEGERDERNNELMPGNGGGPEIARRRAAHREREDHPQGLAR